MIESQVIEKEQSNAVQYRVHTKSHYPKLVSEAKRSSQCGLCGGSYPHKGQCPAKGRRCLTCDKLNHFAKMCRSRSVSNEKPAQKKSYRRPKQRARAVTTEGAESQSEESGAYEASLLSWKMSQRLKLIQVANTVEGTTIPELLHTFSEVTTEMGEYKGEPVKIHINESIKPVAQPNRRIPFHVRKQVEEKLDQLQKDDIIERAEGPTPWVSPIVVVPKPRNANEIRICVDMRSLNSDNSRASHHTDD